jgi:hypothetical protein
MRGPSLDGITLLWTRSLTASGAVVVVQLCLRRRAGGFWRGNFRRESHPLELISCPPPQGLRRGLGNSNRWSRHSKARRRTAVGTCFEIQTECSREEDGPQNSIFAAPARLLQLFFIRFFRYHIFSVFRVGTSHRRFRAGFRRRRSPPGPVHTRGEYRPNGV